MENIKNFFKTDIRYKFLVVLVAVCVALVSLWHLPYSPATWFDEGINIGIAKSLVEHGVYSLQIGPGQFVSERSFLITTNYPALIPVAIFLNLFGFSLIAARLSAVIFLWLFCFLAYKLVRSISSDRIAALLSVALIGTFAPFYGNGKAVLGEVPGLAYFLAALLCLNGLFSFKRFFCAGILIGLALATKPFFLIILPAVLAGEYYSYKKDGASFWKRGIVLFCGISVPLVIWLFTIVAPFSFGTLWSAMHYYSNSYAASNFGSLIASNLLRFVTESTPMHFFLLFIIAAIGFVSRIKKKQLTETEAIIGVFIVLNLFWYLKTPGWYRYFFTAHMLLFLFFPFVLLSVFRKKFALITVLALLLVQSVYLIVQRNNSLYNSAETIQFSKQVFANIKTDAPILIINSPSVAFLLKDDLIYQYLQINPVLHFGDDSLKYNGSNSFPYIVTSGSLNDIPIGGFEHAIATSYHKIAENGHFSLYQINYGTH